jgi:uncharacterized protein (TIGR02145 family)
MRNSLFLLIFYVSLLTGTAQTIADQDGNPYDTVRIGIQTWFAKNLKTKHYNDGTEIPVVTSQSSWAALTTPAFCWYDNNEISYQEAYGALYNGYAVETGKLCPTGWHVPTDAEWNALVDYLGGPYVAGGKLKDTGVTYWQSPNQGATNEVGFSAVPGGIRETDGFYSLGFTGHWWSSTQYEPNYAWSQGLHYDTEGMLAPPGYHYKLGLSVRCLKNTELPTQTGDPTVYEESIYPNPVHDNLYFTLPSVGEKLISIIDPLGREITHLTTYEHEAELDVRQLSAALYWVRIQNSSGVRTLKFIKK